MPAPHRHRLPPTQSSRRNSGRLPDVLRLALTRTEAANSLGMSVDSFERYVQPEIRLIRRGTLRLVPVAELDAWLQKNAEMPLDAGG